MPADPRTPPTNATTARTVVSLARVASCPAGRGSPPAGRSGRSRRPSAAPAPRCGTVRRTATCARGLPARQDQRTRSRPPPSASVAGTDCDKHRACVPRRREEEAGRSGAADGVPEGGAADAPHRRHHGANDMDPPDHRESHQTVHRHQPPASAPSRTNHPPRPAAVIVQCVDDIDEMQRWLGGRFARRAAPEPRRGHKHAGGGSRRSERSTTTALSRLPDCARVSPGHPWPEPRFRPWPTSSPPTAPCHPPGLQRQRKTRVSALTR